MNTSSTKTRALCVATRCTSVEQFVATFHRFCGDDETFFVATMTSRPIGLETPFSIQLADKQPVLRGLCIVLDAWDTPENRYKRPGIRLGIKRLTADSQVVFDRLKAASRSPAPASAPPAPQPQLAAGSQPPGTMRRPAAPPSLPPLSPPRPTPPAVPAIPREGALPLPVVHVPPLGAGTPTTAPRLSRESPPRGVTARPASPVPALPSVPPRTGTTKPGLPVTGKPALPSVVPVVTKPTLPGVAPVEPKPPLPSGLPAEAPPALPSVAPVVTKPTLPGVAAVEAKGASMAVVEAKGASMAAVEAKGASVARQKATSASVAPLDGKPALPGAASVPASPTAAAQPVPPASAEATPASSAAVSAPEPGAPPAPAARAPIAVTRFQIALRVDATPPSLTGVEFKPTELVPRKRLDRIIGEPSPSEAQSDDALPAVILDRLSGPVESVSDAAVPGFAPYENTSPTVDPLADRRTPGSSLVLPANPLQDLSDESIEGFVDCTLYEENGNIFHPGVDGAEWADVTDPEQPLPARLAPRTSLPRLSPPSITVPAMPYDAPPSLTVRAQGGSESLTVAPDDPALSRAVAGELGARLAGATEPEPVRASSGPLGVPSTEIIDDPPPSPPAVIVDDPALSRAVAGEIRRAADDDPEQTRTASGELWSETLRRTPADGLPRTQPRPDTPLPRPASNVPMDLGDSPDPASWFDSVSLPHGGAAPRPAMAMEAAVAPAMVDPAIADPATAQSVSAAGGAPSVAVDPSLLPAMPPDPGMPPGPGFAPGMPPGPGFAPGMPPGPGFAPGMPPGPDPAFMPGPLDPAMPAAMPPGMAPGMSPTMPPMYGPVESGPVGAPGYGVDSAPYPRYSAADVMSLPGMPAARVQPPWQRWLLIAGSAVIAIILAFVVARMVRGSDRAAPASTGATPSAPARGDGPPRAVPAAPGNAAAGDPDGATAGDGEPAAGAEATDEDGAAAARGTPVIGSGPCRFTVGTTPPGALVRFDDQQMGLSPITIQGSCDKHKVDIAHARYQSVTRWLTLAADKPQQLDISLPRPIHAVTVTSVPPGAELSIDGRRAGTTPAVVQMPGFATVNLTFTKPGFQTVTRKVYSKLAQDRVSVKLTK